MLLENHMRYTKEALEGMRLSEETQADVVAGASANDLCEFTNEYQLIRWIREKIRSLFCTRKKRASSMAIVQSHFGILASMHAMSKTPGEPAATTIAEVTSWFKFLNDLALGSPIDPDADIGSDNTPIAPLFSGLRIDYEDLFDSRDISRIRHRSVGMMLHIVEDSFTPCHCEREKGLEIAEFYCYKLQDRQKHKAADDVSPSNKEHLISQCAECARSVLLRREPYDYSSILRLRANPNNSGGGPYQ